jgi:hypothetical protein
MSCTTHARAGHGGAVRDRTGGSAEYTRVRTPDNSTRQTHTYQRYRQTRTDRQMRMHTHTRTHVADARTQTHTHAHTRRRDARTHILTQHACPESQRTEAAYKQTHTQMHTHAQTHAHTHTRTHTHARNHTRTHTASSIWSARMSTSCDTTLNLPRRSAATHGAASSRAASTRSLIRLLRARRQTSAPRRSNDVRKCARVRVRAGECDYVCVRM